MGRAHWRRCALFLEWGLDLILREKARGDFALELAGHGALKVTKTLGDLQESACAVEHFFLVVGDEVGFTFVVGAIDHEPVDCDTIKIESLVGVAWLEAFVCDAIA